MKYELVVGLEIHVQLDTKTKFLCGCDNESFGVEPNENTCPVCQGFPGMLPKVNEQAIEMGARAALALNLQVQNYSEFDRKNYFYPDNPTAYQVTQMYHPVSLDGYFDIPLEDGSEHRVRLNRMHLECDAGKLVHTADGSLVDFNRAGTPLMEIVSEPDFRNTEQVKSFLQELQKILRYTGSSRADMEKGNMRCDANISLRLKGEEEYGTRCEIKNINSFSNVVDAIRYEATRQAKILDTGGQVDQETRGWNVEKQESYTMRSKEDAMDYRYFPEPDLPPVELSDEYIQSLKDSLPELPLAKQKRFVEDMGIAFEAAKMLASDRELALYFEKTADISGDAKKSANWILSELLGRMKEEGKELHHVLVLPDHIAEIIALIASGDISGKIAKDVFDIIYKTGDSPSKVVEDKGWKQVSDIGAIEKMIDEVLQNNPTQLEQYRGGQDKLFGFFVGQVMKASQGQANPGMINEILKKKLA